MSESIYRALECLSRREALSKATKATFLDTTSGKLYFTYISCAIISIVMAFLWKWTEVESFKLFSVIFLIFCYIGYISHPFVLLIIHRKFFGKFFRNPLSVIYDNVKRNHQVDLQYLSYFMSKKKQDLEVVLLEVVAEKEAFEKRIALLVGSIDKIGLAPGLLALFLSMNKLKDIELDWVLAIAYAIPIFYGFGVFSHILATKMSRHITILEYVISKKV